MNIFGICLPEMILIMLVALLIFGPKKLPEIGRSMGKAIKGFQDASREFESEFKREADRLEQVTTESITDKVVTDNASSKSLVTETPSAEVEIKEVVNAADA